MNKKILYRATFFLILILAFFLRLYKLDKLVPPYWEEAALGYDAFSISQTLRDHHGNFLPLVAFESFGDWKPALYFYTIVPFIKLFGLGVMSVRLPSLVAGLSIVIGVGVAVRQILDLKQGQKAGEKNAENYVSKSWGLMGMLVTAISPWAILFSRAGWEVNLATALVLWGVISFFKFLQAQNLEKSERPQKKPTRFLLLSILLLVFSMYTYHATRLIAPILGLGLVAVWWAQFSLLENLTRLGSFKKISTFAAKNSRQLIFAALFALLLTLPLLKNLTSPTFSQRFKETSIFSNLDIIKESNGRRLEQPGLIGRIFYHRYVLFGREIIKNYLSHFNLSFLFLQGDANPRHSVQYLGQLYHIEIIFLLLGFFWVSKTWGTKTLHPRPGLQKKFLAFLLFWLAIGIVPASISYSSPHALRILPVMPIFMVMITLGIRQLFLFFKNWNFAAAIVFWVIILSFYFTELLMFGRFYTTVYPYQYSNEWQAGYEDLVVNFNIFVKNERQVYVSRYYGRPLMYYWFYNKIDPRLVQNWDGLAAQDQGEYLEFVNFKAINSLSEIKVTPAIIALSPQEFLEFKEARNFRIEILRNIVNQAGDIVFIVAEIR